MIIKLNDWCCLLNLSYVWVISVRRDPGENIMTHPVRQCVGAAEVRPPSLCRREQTRAPSQTFDRSVPSHARPGITWPWTHIISQMKFSFFFFCNCSWSFRAATFTKPTAVSFCLSVCSKVQSSLFLFGLCWYFMSHQNCTSALWTFSMSSSPPDRLTERSSFPHRGSSHGHRWLWTLTFVSSDLAVRVSLRSSSREQFSQFLGLVASLLR